MAKMNYPEKDISGNFSSGISTHVDWEPRCNIIQAGNMLVIEVELPGVIQDDVSIVLQDDSHLIIRGTKRQPRFNDVKSTKMTYYLFEREFGTFYKRIVIDFPLDTSKINSIMEGGVLTVRIPKKEAEPISAQIQQEVNYE